MLVLLKYTGAYWLRQYADAVQSMPSVDRVLVKQRVKTIRANVQEGRLAFA